ncbi:MAG: hypothetical protein KC464_10650 [Myxococcales bacterium]|nr:hypothetical protein [Myxococcales bacterium]
MTDRAVRVSCGYGGGAGRRRGAASGMLVDMDPELREQVIELFRCALREGFDHATHHLERVSDVYGDELEGPALEAFEAELPALYAEAAARHRDEAAAWPAITDCDRLDAAFDELNERGILARHRWWCCQNCGHATMGAERDTIVADGGMARGYAFYHVQDTEAVADGGPLFLAFGAFDGDDAADKTIAQETVDVLAAHDLAVRWDGSTSSRIAVPLRWQRRARPLRWCGD